ncbi:MAG: YabP/YqfC family sporulation protein [Bacilli bacterium]|nr:YabP/YqfC family sporulation protein [Bacilli bacterium]MDD3895579.1 YabP/YqfC family sporulation protein [Bacilli bacterium]MDD4407781.1 YabP/YqfC family sporulation protein [Bacilli bacterium]
MLEVINNALNNNDFYICLYNNNVYIYNYQEIISFNNDLIKIRLKDKIIKIKGSKMLIEKMHLHELLIRGSIGSVSYE